MSSKTPRVCIGVPVHNGGDLLQRCLQSIVDQTFEDFTVVIFENASTDDTLKIAEEFCRKDKRFSISASTQLLSAQENFKRALRVCSEAAEYFCLRAHDDYTSDEFLEELVLSLDENPEKTHAAPLVLRIQPDGQVRPLRPGKHVTEPLTYLRQSRWRDSWPAPPSWFYGLFKGSSSAEVWISAIQRLGSPWASDRLALMEFLLSGKTVYNESAVFYCLITSNSEATYPEKTIYRRLRSRLIYFDWLLKISATIETRNLLERVKLKYICWQTARKHTHYYGARLIFGLNRKRS